MLIKPSIDSLLDKVESKYTLVITAAQRGRQIREELNEKKVGEKFINNSGTKLKEVSVALQEIQNGKVHYHYNPSMAQLDELLTEKAAEEVALMTKSDEDENNPEPTNI